MKISEIFVSIQGEGVFIGQPSVFVRFYGCNLNCWWCDTPQGKEPSVKYKELHAVDILRKIKNARIKNVVLTGGEPLIQNKDEFCGLIKKLVDYGYNITVETNGTVPPPRDYRGQVYWSVSPKLDTKIDFSILKKYFAREMDSSLKFVIKNKKWVDKTKRVIGMMPEKRIKTIPIIFQPMWRRCLFSDLVKWVINDNFLRTLNVRVLPQVHKIGVVK